MSYLDSATSRIHKTENKEDKLAKMMKKIKRMKSSIEKDKKEIKQLETMEKKQKSIKEELRRLAKKNNIKIYFEEDLQPKYKKGIIVYDEEYFMKNRITGICWCIDSKDRYELGWSQDGIYRGLESRICTEGKHTPCRYKQCDNKKCQSWHIGNNIVIRDAASYTIKAWINNTLCEYVQEQVYRFNGDYHTQLAFHRKQIVQLAIQIMIAHVYKIQE